jgi:hypothetical protein
MFSVFCNLNKYNTMGPNKATRWSGASGFRSDIATENGFLEIVRDRHILKAFLIRLNAASGILGLIVSEYS